ncbi:excisionase family DNA binding protein [Phycicoccus badiiscoriae]|uniref:Excisionase family DNA binding protein n=1 Tax=Pedococcus badiiscoriae TaxID=642776 RepID=A0A852WA49_9MICO|nr:helix-turn-helix domain-containing protein [Pedococcus badiiscoriae]NYG05709.1 excisionase family DNA binding protein [Pedococcus badiiscoriae]
MSTTIRFGSSEEPIAVSVKEASGLTGLSEYELRQAINRGELPAKRRGRRVLVPVDGLKTWIDSLPDYVD